MLTPTTETVLAVVHVTAPPGINPGAIEAELTRSVSTHPKLAMTAEVTLADDVRSQPRRDRHRHGYVAVLSLATAVPAGKLAKRVQKAMRKGLRNRFGDAVSARVQTDMSAAAQAACWCTMRGAPDRRA